MNTRTLSKEERSSLEVIRNTGTDTALIFITETGLNKSIFDATTPFRTLLKTGGIHDYDSQGKGRSKHGIDHEIRIITAEDIIQSRASFYRPETKQGDPRFWPSRCSRYAAPNDIFVAFVHDSLLHLHNLSRSRLYDAKFLDQNMSISQLLKSITQGENLVADELLALLYQLAAKGPIARVGSGSMAVGWSIESALGLPPNSKKAPDYKGIEIKAGRGTVSRSTLFAQVPDWDLSPIKSSHELLKKCGYKRNGRLQLYCTTSTIRKNSQNLRLKLTKIPAWLIEYLDLPQPEDIAVWPLSALHKSLLDKHRETFWITAPQISVNSIQAFELKSIVHTRRPNIAQFDQLLLDGEITVDHLSRMIKNRAAERGPLFKISKTHRAELFSGPPRKFSF